MPNHTRIRSKNERPVVGTVGLVAGHGTFGSILLHSRYRRTQSEQSAAFLTACNLVCNFSKSFIGLSAMLLVDICVSLVSSPKNTCKAVGVLPGLPRIIYVVVSQFPPYGVQPMSDHVGDGLMRIRTYLARSISLDHENHSRSAVRAGNLRRFSAAPAKRLSA